MNATPPPAARLRSVAAEDEDAGYERRREFRFTPADFSKIAALVNARTGIRLAESKASLMYGRLARRLRALGLPSFKAYREVLSDPERGEEEMVFCINALTTNLTAFFRESHHFEYLRDAVLPEAEASASERADATRRLRIWSAGCSSGEEPYSIAAVVANFMRSRPAQRWNARILATDLDTNMLERAGSGTYPWDALSLVPLKLRDAYFRDLGDGEARVSDDLRRLIVFKHLNLLTGWPMKGPFDAIFCRNVLIYFDHPTRVQIAERFADLLKDGGYLFLGHSENLYRVSDRFQALGRTTYRRTR